jgi:chromosome segregation ATPase
LQTIRDIFTFGLGSLGDWFGLDEAVRYAEKLVESCQREFEQAEADIQAAETALSNIRNEVSRFYELHSSVDSYKGDLQGVEGKAIALRNKNMALQNKSLDISLYLGGLVASTETIEIEYDAAQFAKAVIAVEQLLVTPTRVKGLIRDDAQQLDSTLEMISKSDAIADVLDDAM